MLSFPQSYDLKPSLWDRLHSNRVSGWAFSTHKPKRQNTSLPESLDNWRALDRSELKVCLRKGHCTQSKCVCLHCGYSQVLTWVFAMDPTQYFYMHYCIKSSQTLCEESIVIFTLKVKKLRMCTVTRLTCGHAASKCQKGIKTRSLLIFLKSRESPKSDSIKVVSAMRWSADLMSEPPLGKYLDWPPWCKS